MAVMKLIFLILSLIFALASAQACEKKYNPEWDLSVIEILKYNDADSTYINFGTGFLVFMYDSTENQVLISNKHVLNNRSDLYMRVNLKNKSLKKVDTVSLEELYSLSKKLIVPQDESLDLAALPMPVIHTNWDILIKPKSHFSSSDDISRGDEIYYLGFPLGISIHDKTIPVYRKGVIALDRKFLDGEYLIDGVVIGGSSGSPVFDCNDDLVGVIYSHLNYYTQDPGYYDVFGPNVKINAKLRVNSGLGRMIPIDRVVDFLEEIRPGWKKK